MSRGIFDIKHNAFIHPHSCFSPAQHRRKRAVPAMDPLAVPDARPIASSDSSSIALSTHLHREIDHVGSVLVVPLFGIEGGI